MVMRTYHTECTRQEDGRWLATVPGLPSVEAYGDTEQDARSKASDLLLFELYNHVYRRSEIEQLHDDAAEGRLDAVKMHIARGIDIDSRNPAGGTPLMIASKRGHLAVVKSLLDAGANPNISLSKVHYTALHTAAQEGHQGIVDALIDHGADIDAKTQCGETPLVSAAHHGHTATVALLLKRGADSQAHAPDLRVLPSATSQRRPKDDQHICDTPSSLQAKATRLRRDQNWAGARATYENILQHDIVPIDQVKMLANIMQMYDHENDKEMAVSTAYDALKLYDIYRLENDAFGNFVRGYILGYIRRSEGKGFWIWTPPFSRVLPFKMILSPFDQLKVNVSTTAFGSALGAVIGVKFPIPNVSIIWGNGYVSTISLIGGFISFLLTRNILQRAVSIVKNVGVRRDEAALPIASNIITCIGIMSCAILPSIIIDPYNWWSALILPGALGLTQLTLIINQHARINDEPPLSK